MGAEAAAAHELAEVLRGLGLEVVGEPRSGMQARCDLVLDIGGRLLPVEVEALATVTPQLAETLAGAQPLDPDAAMVVVADRVVASARERLQQAGWGWLDRRGHVRISAPGVFVDSNVPSTGAGGAEGGDPLGRQVVREVATWILAHPSERPGVRALARRLGRSPSSVSTALHALQEQGLTTQGTVALVPELFWELADRWATPRQALAAEPEPGDGSLTSRLGLGLEEVSSTTGWALTDTLAAAWYGAPVGARSGTPPDFLVPSKQLERLARITLGAAAYDERACTVRAAPVRWACEERIDGTNLGAATHWPLAHPLVVALDLATDPGRGREILDAWTPPQPWRRVW